VTALAEAAANELRDHRGLPQMVQRRSAAAAPGRLL
jgi:hypothetical protein